MKLQGRGLVLPWPCPVHFDDSQACAEFRTEDLPRGKNKLDQLDAVN